MHGSFSCGTRETTILSVGGLTCRLSRGVPERRGRFVLALDSMTIDSSFVAHEALETPELGRMALHKPKPLFTSQRSSIVGKRRASSSQRLLHVSKANRPDDATSELDVVHVGFKGDRSTESRSCRSFPELSREAQAQPSSAPGGEI